METKEIKRRETRGITLIALVVTIVVLLILAGTSIAMLSGDDGIITQAQKSNEQTEIAEVKEEARIDIAGIQTENEGKLEKDKFVEVLKTYFDEVPEEDMLPEDLSTLILTTKAEYGSHQIKISEIWDGTFDEELEQEGIIHFYVEGVEYTALEGETWREWIARVGYEFGFMEFRKNSVTLSYQGGSYGVGRKSHGAAESVHNEIEEGFEYVTGATQY